MKNHGPIFVQFVCEVTFVISISTELFETNIIISNKFLHILYIIYLFWKRRRNYWNFLFDMYHLHAIYPQIDNIIAFSCPLL